MKQIVAMVLSLALGARAFAIFGVGDVVFVAGNTDPGEIAHRAAEIAQLVSQVEQATQMVRQANTLVKFAGDPKGAVRSLSDLARISDSLGQILGPENGTADGLRQLSAQFRAGDQMANEMDRLDNAFAGLSREINSFGQSKGASPDLYQALYAAESLARTAREQIKKGAEARKQIDEELRRAHEQLRNATTESEKQAAAAQIAALEARHNVMTAQQQAMLADLELEERSKAREAYAQAVQREESENAEGDVLVANARKRQQESDARLANRLRTTTDSAGFDYGKITSVWGTPPRK